MLKYLIIIIFVIFTSSSNCPNTYILIDKPETVVGCGGFLFAGQYLFINANDSSQVIGIIMCPDGYGDKFFKKEAKYNIKFSKDTTLSSHYSWMNFFENPNNIPKKIISKIENAE